MKHHVNIPAFRRLLHRSHRLTPFRVHCTNEQVQPTTDPCACTLRVDSNSHLHISKSVHLSLISLPYLRFRRSWTTCCTLYLNKSQIQYTLLHICTLHLFSYAAMTFASLHVSIESHGWVRTSPILKHVSTHCPTMSSRERLPHRLCKENRSSGVRWTHCAIWARQGIISSSNEDLPSFKRSSLAVLPSSKKPWRNSASRCCQCWACQLESWPSFNDEMVLATKMFMNFKYKWGSPHSPNELYRFKTYVWLLLFPKQAARTCVPQKIHVNFGWLCSHDWTNNLLSYHRPTHAQP